MSSRIISCFQRQQRQIAAPWAQGPATFADFEKDIAALDAKVQSPWDETSVDLREQEQQRMRAQNYKFENLFEEPSAVLRAQEQQKRSAGNYKYESMFEPPLMSEDRKKQLAEYKYNPPYRCSFNQEKIVEKDKKRMDPSKNPKTLKPWEYGNVPADPVSKHIVAQPPTALWSSPPEEKKETEIESSGDPVLDSLRKQLRARGASGIAGLARKFRIMDDDGSDSLDLAEFKKAMKECDVVDLSDKAIAHLFRYFDRDDSGSISYDEFLSGIRGQLNKRRLALVKLAFSVVDRDGSGVLDIDDIVGVYNAKSHPDVIMNRRTEREILEEFIGNFEVGPKKDHVVTEQEFVNYYANISASVDSDDYFELMIRNAWHISGGEGVCENTTNRRVLVTHADGRQTVEEIKNDLGIGAKDKDKMIQRLQQQGVAVKTIDTMGIGDMHNQAEAKDFYNNCSSKPPLQQQGSTASSRGSQQPQQVQGRRNDPAAAAPVAGNKWNAAATTGGASERKDSNNPHRLSSYTQNQNLRPSSSSNNNQYTPNASMSSAGRLKPVRLGDTMR